MKNAITLLLLTIALNHTVLSQSSSDKQLVFSTCLQLIQEELPELQQHSLLQSNQPQGVFTDQQQVGNWTVNIYTKNKSDHLPTLDFYIYEVKENKARLDFTVYGEDQNPIRWYYMEFQKEAEEWNLTNIKTKSI
ncbi:hypothetical protein PEDI_31250 [Persicobacter diffluens]|uniref:DUF3888 domain-containing protein n=1 Tax=Persicobacter diffluens TaxID=981 RepID=A0AAN4VZF2_9BACT|nr:hypothetical protein PEDI_31250 [Persicobacter diffluens]